MRKASVAINPKHRLFGLGDKAGLELHQRFVDLVDQRKHRSLHMLVIDVLPSLEPIPVIVLFQTTEKLQSLFWEHFPV